MASDRRPPSARSKPAPPTPWARPMDLRELSGAPHRASIDVSSAGKRDGVRVLAPLPRRREPVRPSLDFEAQFHHAAGEQEVDEECDVDPRLCAVIKERQNKFERLASRKIVRNASMATSEGKGRASERRDPAGVRFERSKSFLHDVSSGIRTFLARPGRSQRDDDIPVRLNRLHGANESSISVLAPTIRKEFLRMSTFNGRRSICQPRVQTRDTNLAKLDHALCDEDSKADRSEVTFSGELKHLREYPSSSTPAEQLQYVTSCTPVESLEDEEHTIIPATEDDLNEESGAIHVVHDENHSSCCSEWSFQTGDETALELRSALKPFEFPLNISDLIQQYDAADSVKEGHDYGAETATSRPSFKLESRYDINRIRALFERPSMKESTTPAQSQNAPAEPVSRDKSYSSEPEQQGRNADTDATSFSMSDKSQVASHTGRTTSESDAEDSCELCSIRGVAPTITAMEKLPVEASFLSSITPSVSPSLTPDSKDSFHLPRTIFDRDVGCDDRITPHFPKQVRPTVSFCDRVRVASAEDTSEVHEVQTLLEVSFGDACAASPEDPDNNGCRAPADLLNLRDLFDTMELAPGACSPDNTPRTKQHVRVSAGEGVGEAGARHGGGREGMRGAPAKAGVARAKSFAERREKVGGIGRRTESTVERRRKSVAAAAHGRGRVGLEGAWFVRTARSQTGKVRHKLELFRNMISADDY